jgi:3-oxoacyl-[acyl-carrier protein] reductase
MLAREYAPGLRANVVAPGLVDTAFIRGGTGRSDESGAPRVDVAEYAARVPLGRVAVPEDVVGPILFLCGPASAFVNGQILHVNGGAYLP